MRYLRWIIVVLFLVGGVAAFGQQSKEQILKIGFTCIQADMVTDACDIIGYTNSDVRKTLDNKPFSINDFYDALIKDVNAGTRKTTSYCLKEIIYSAIDRGNLHIISGNDYSADSTAIITFKDNLIEDFNRSNLSCYNTNADKDAKINDFNGKSADWGNKITSLCNDYRNYLLAETNGDWDLYINLNSNKNKLFVELATKNKKEKEEDEAYMQIQKLQSYADISICESFLSSYHDSKYKKQVEEKKSQLEALIDTTYISDNEYNWYGRTLTQSGRYDTIIEGKKHVLNLTIEEPLQVIETDDKISDFRIELNKCNNREAIEALLNESDYIKYREYADSTYWLLCTDTTGWNDYISFYGEKGKHYAEAKKQLDEKRMAKTEQPKEEQEQMQINDSLTPIGTGQEPDHQPTPPPPTTQHNYRIWYLIAGIAGVALLLTLLLRKRKKNQSQPVSDDKELREENAAFERCSTIFACDYYLNTYPNGRFVKEVIAKKASLFEQMQKEEDTAFEKCTTITACEFYLIKYPKGKYVNEVKDKLAKLKENKEKPKPKPYPKQGEWVVVGASVKGNGHIQSNMPCQDNNKFELLGKGWGVTVVSDGAGSAAHSDMGSKVVVERGVVHFKNLIEKEGWMEKNILPSDAEWLQKSYFVLKTIRNEVEMVAKKNNVDVKSLSATCLAVVFSPMGLLVVHVGDGRMGCKTMSGEWKAIMTPHKGEEANQTLFLVSDFWDIPNYVQSGVLVPESIVVREPVEAFAVMSDGCESTAWLCTAQNAETGKYYDQNKPFEGFFNPLEETLVTFHKDNVPEEERKEKWYKFIESGTKGFVKEQDDKTMILGVFCGK